MPTVRRRRRYYIGVRCNHVVWPRGVMVGVLARDTKGRGFDPRLFHFQVTTLGKLFRHNVPPAPHSNFGTGQGAVMPCGSEGNRRSGVALAMRHRLKWIIRAPTGSRPSQGDEHPTYALLVEYGPFTYLPTYVAITGLQDFVSRHLAVENWPGLYSYHVQENGARSSRLTGLVERKSTPTRLIFAACLKSDVEFAILRTYYTPFPKKI